MSSHTHGQSVYTTNTRERKEHQENDLDGESECCGRLPLLIVYNFQNFQNKQNKGVIA